MLPTLRENELAADRERIDTYLHKLLDRGRISCAGAVQDGMHYAVFGPAQRIRPILSLRVARMLHCAPELVLRAAGSVELVHCASLVIDDLPCMDNSAVRRNRPAAHIRFGESTAVLAAFALVALAARALLLGEFNTGERERLAAFQLKLLGSLDCNSLIGGQALDLELAGSPALKAHFQVAQLKTVPLFNLAVDAGCVFADLDTQRAALLSSLGREFGLAFQLTDDLLDGDLHTMALVDEKLSAIATLLRPFGHAASHILELVQLLNARVPAAQAS